MKRILALDLGTKTGFAYNWACAGVDKSVLFPAPACTFTLATDREITAWGKNRLARRCDPRVRRLFNILSGMDKPDMVVFEDVQFASYTYQVQLWSSLRAAVWLAFVGGNIECVPVGTLKIWATGCGSATKDQMKRAMFTRGLYLGRELDDNAIDALWLLNWAEHNLGRMD